MAKPIYLDYAAATPMDQTVLKAMTPYFADKFYNPSAVYLAAKAVHQDIEKARTKVATYLGAKSSEIVFTAGGTEANNLAINGVMQAFPGTSVVISKIEHDSIIKPTQLYDHKLAKVHSDGLVDPNDLIAKVDDQTVLVSIIYASNEMGTIEPIREISLALAKLRQERLKNGNKLPLYLHTDACQAAAYLDLHVDKLGVDLMTLNGGKIYGPKQSGCLYVKTGVKLKPQILGGGQENNQRSGTENVAAIVGMATALELVQTRRKAEVERLKKLQTLCIDLISDKIASASINGSLKQRLPNNVNVTIAGQDNESLMMKLDEKGIICAVGSACSASNDEPSHVLKAIGLTDKQAQASLRFSFGHSTTRADIIRLVTELQSSLSTLA